MIQMYRRIDRYNRDYLGNEDEQQDFDAAWTFFNEIIADPSEKVIESC